ncbi:protein transport protein SEC24-like [Pollicipes pollicipes]|uniref:protein transport protein SEC24-like n=1 Tax=Pollicipes pollicipes TaxID=41117 RepID=UPI0018854292|nr:protein transport protein SEC24-like [Pollicipes pollicipes]
MPQNGTGMYPPYDQNGYLHKPGGQQRMLHASTPIEFGARPPADSPSHSQHYYAHESVAPPPQPTYYPQETSLCRGQPAYYAAQAGAGQPGYPAPEAAPSPGLAHRPSYYSQDVSDTSSASQRLSGAPYDETVGSAPGGRTGLGRGRAHVDRYADPPRPSYAQDVQMKPGTMATPV